MTAATLVASLRDGARAALLATQTLFGRITLRDGRWRAPLSSR